MQQAELNPEQRLAVETTEGAVCVIAGPGAGKTRTLTSRYVYLVRDLGINPQNILCVTFTNKAAQEMKARIRAMTGDLDLGQICTFHAFCVRFLKDEGYVIGIPKDFIVIDEEDELELLNEVYETFGIPGNLMKFSAAMDVIGNFKDDSNYIRDLVLTSPESLRRRFSHRISRIRFSTATFGLSGRSSDSTLMMSSGRPSISWTTFRP